MAQFVLQLELQGMFVVIHLARIARHEAPTLHKQPHFKASGNEGPRERPDWQAIRY